MSRRNGHPPLMIPPSHRAAVAAALQHQRHVAFLLASEQFHRAGNLGHALRGYFELLKQIQNLDNPVCRRAMFLSGLCAYQMRLYDDAVELLENVRDHETKTRRANPKFQEDPNVHYNLGLIYGAARRPHDALDAYRMALALKPDFTAAENNLGNTLRELGDLEGAQACYDRLLAEDPADPHARYNLAHVLLLHGQLKRGFELYEARWKVAAWNAEYGRQDITSPKLERDSDPCRVFVFQEQGIGDTLQFVRYLPMLESLGHEVIFEAPQELGDWFKRGAIIGHKHVITCTKRGDPVPEHDRSIPLLSLPELFGTATESDIPAPRAPIILADSPLWTAPGDTRDVIAFAWAGNANHHADHHRTAPLEQLRALFTRPNTRFVSLQVGARGVELLSVLPTLDVGENSEVIECTAALGDFEKTAALIRQCKAVVTVDTSVAHLGGVLGIPTFILTSWLSEWRWQLNRTDSPWYPSVRLVRQPTLGDWPSTAIETLKLLENLK